METSGSAMADIWVVIFGLFIVIVSGIIATAILTRSLKSVIAYILLTAGVCCLSIYFIFKNQT
jgi:hypothetical protein